ncbi:MAG: hypothetical protein OXR73_35585 [Myxococcales bacterium]|nr:hypothetical protein [Myxococcales bacterium]
MTLSARSQITIGGALLLLLAACATQPTFRDAPIVWQADDARSIPEPQEREYSPEEYFTNVFVARRLTRTLELRDLEPAGNTNALDEVPNSTWFTNRLGVRDLTPAIVARGPVTSGPPKVPLTIIRGKNSGGNAGFFARDATGRAFLVKFDTLENPEMQTAASVIVNRAMWALGYNVPEDTLVTFASGDLKLSETATTEDDLGNERRMTRADVHAVLSAGPRSNDGRYRASASLLLSGTPKGGFRPEGTRRDDPNDRVDHEARRELRALRVFSAWLGHTDMKEDNTLDMYVHEGERRFLRHYLIDFGEALGGHQAEKGRLEDGYEHLWDWEDNTAAIFALGLWKRAWESQQQTPWPSIGAFGARHFKPEAWKEAYPYWPFWEADAADLYWGAKLVMRFERPLIEAIVAQGALSNPRAAAYLVEALSERKRKIGHAWLEALTPFDYLRIHPSRLCGTDLGVHFGLAQEGAIVAVSEDGHIVDEVRVNRDGRACLPIASHDGYEVLRLRTRRGQHLKPAMQVHYRAGKRARILGVIRLEP